MKLMKTSLIAATLAIGTTAGVANADPVVTGTFSIDIYRYLVPVSPAPGGATDAQATLDRITDGTTGAVDFQVTFTGALNFGTFTQNVDNATVFDWLETSSSNWSVTGGSKDDLKVTLSTPYDGSPTGSPPPGQTTMFDITPVSPGLDFASMSITHDDGFSLYDSSDALIQQFVGPNVKRTTDIVNLPVPDDYRLIYVAANGDPSVLQVHGTVVPIPAAAWLFGSALVGMGFVGRRKMKA